MQEGSKKTSGQAEKGKETTTVKADKTAKVSVSAAVKAEPVKKAAEFQEQMSTVGAISKERRTEKRSS